MYNRGGRGRGRSYNPWYANRSNANQTHRSAPIFAVNANNDAGGIRNRDDDADNQPHQSGHQSRQMPQMSDEIVSVDREPGAFWAWKLYFPLLSYKKSVELVRKIKAFERHIEMNVEMYDFVAILENLWFTFDLRKYDEFQELTEDWPDFNDDILFKTTQALACMGLAMHNIVHENGTKQSDDLNRKIYVRPIGFHTVSNFKIAKDSTNELVKITGTIVAMEKILLHCRMLCFKCPECSTDVIVKQSSTSDKITVPSKCIRGCTVRGSFKRINASPHTIFQPRRKITVQDSSFSTGDTKNVLDVEIALDYCELAPLGSYVSCTGVIKYKKIVTYNNTTIRPYMKCFVLDKINSSSTKDQSTRREPDTQREMQIVDAMRAEPSIFRKLVNSLAPEIIGREDVKAGLILSLLSGNNSLGKGKRAESHILIVGNPGLGKSHLLKAAAELSPISNYVNGPTCTGVSLTGRVGKNQQLSAGVLVQSNEGICCIDEFDKMDKKHTDPLLECMEQQTVSIAKKGCKDVVPAKVTIIAAANPTLNFYAKDKSLEKNLKISTPILSRFDLVFILTEQPKAYQAHAAAKWNRCGNTSSSFSSQSSNRFNGNINHNDLNWLKLQEDENFEPLTTRDLQLFLQYAKKNIAPKLSEAAKVEVAKHFLKMREARKDAGEGKMLDVTFRQFEALLRMVMARARADLRTEVTKEDALDVINLQVHSTSEATDTPNVDDWAGPAPKRAKIVPGTKLSIPKQIKAFYDHLTDHCESTEQSYFTYEELKNLAKEIGIDRDYNAVVHRMNNIDNTLLKKPGGFAFVSS